MVDKQNKLQCTGCKMCSDLCPQKAITFSTTEDGYWYPSVDEKACTKCGVCVNTCPIYGTGCEKAPTRQEAYAVWSREDGIRRESTSGGLYYEFASYVLSQNGYLVGSVYTEDYRGAFHIVSDQKEELPKIMGSKYFQSDTEGIYKKTKEALKTGRLVLFTGAPCQVAALYSYLKQDYENLITLDFICRGVPSPLLQGKKIDLYESKAHSKVVFYRDKSKVVGWSDFGELIRFANGKKRFISRWKDKINNCFIEENLNLRESCYQCQFKCGRNTSDITIGDFWGINGVTERDKKYGVSAMVVNTDRGDAFVRAVGSKIYRGRRTVQEVQNGNPAYSASVKRPDNREEFFRDVVEKGLEYAVRHHSPKGLKHSIAVKKRLLVAELRPWIPLMKQALTMDWLQFFYYNFFNSSVHREKGAFLLPSRGTKIQFARSAELELKANLTINYYPCYKRGSQTSLLKIGKGGKLVVHNRVELSYANTFSIADYAKLEVGYFFMNIGSNVICNHAMSIGNNVLLGRDVCIFDSDYHPIFNEEGKIVNEDREVVIEDNVWIGARSMVLKGSHIHEGAIVSANSLVMGEVEGNRVFINKRESKSIGEKISWQR